MAFDHEIEAFIKEFVKDIAEKNVAIFAGAGMSKSSGYVDWKELLRDIADELGLKIDDEHDLISLAQYHVNHRASKAGITKKILEEFSEQAESSINHKILARLPIPTYWTTNYDTLIEDSLKEALKVVDIKHEVDQLANTKPKRDVVVYKMHGDASSPSKAIIAKEQYEEYYKTHEQFITALSGDLISKTFLFIGFSFTDPNLDYVLSRLRTSSNKQHYCFMKRESRLSNDCDETFKYKTRKQELKINDLKRYKIQTVLVDEYETITEILKEIEIRFRKKTIFISGSAEEYGNWQRSEAQSFIHELSKKLIISNLRIVNGFGWGVGSAVINGALEAIYSAPEKFSEDQLIVRPFPQFETNNKNLADLWEDYRQRMIALSGIALFIFGNKKSDNGTIIPANGVMREFEIAVGNGVIPIPIGATGYMAKIITSQLEENPTKYFGTNTWIYPLIKELNDEKLTQHEIIKKTINIIQRLGK